MKLSYKARRRWSLVLLLIWLPLYVVLAVNLVELFERPGVVWELLIYVVLGIIWVLPFRFVFRGIARPDPDTAPGKGRDR